MKRNYFTLILFILLIFTACEDDKSNSANATSTSININAQWKGYLLSDGSDIERTADTCYTINIYQSNTSLLANLSIPSEFNFPSPVELTGTIKNDSTFSLKGNSGNDTIVIQGTIEEDNSLHLIIDGIEEELQFVFLHKNNTLTTGSFSNQYFLELKLGQAGVGRSVILVHGMDDNSKSWDKMIDYLKDHNIGDSYNVWVYEYKWWNHIIENGEKMADFILECQDSSWVSMDPIIIAHSMGGLVSRAYIADYTHLKSTNFYRLVTLSTPHLGSKLSHFVPFGNTSGVGDLKPGSDFLNYIYNNTTDINSRSKYWLLNGRISTYHSCYHFGVPFCYHWHSPKPSLVEKTGHGVLDKPNDGMVTNASARFEGNSHYAGDKSPHVVNTFEWINHSYLNKDTRVCKWVKDFILDHP